LGIALFEGGVFSHTGIVLGNGQMAHSTLASGSSIVKIDIQPYSKRGAYISRRYRGSQQVINTAKSLAVRRTGYGFLPGQKVCSTFNAAAFNQAGYNGWYGIGPNSQAQYMPFTVTKIYGQ
jgi:hypothetical protein